MYKRFKGSFIITLLLIIMLSTSVLAESIKIVIDNKPLSSPVEPVVVGGRTLVPLRAIFEAMGAVVEWDNPTRTVTGIRGQKVIKLQIDNKVASVDGQEILLDVPGTIINGSTMVPVRFIAESLGANVDWDNESRTVIINSITHKVVRVVDGDTIIVDYNGTEERLRLIGIDTPESVHPDKSKNVEEGIIASEFTKKSLEGKDVILEFDVQERDQYGRLLAYVWIGGEMFNKILLEEGYARIATYPPNIKYVEEFLELEKKARNDNKGFWAYEDMEQTESYVIDKSKNPIGPIGNSETAQYIGSLKSDKYHYPGYKHAGPIKDENLIYFESKEHAIANGYKPCGLCFK